MYILVSIIFVTFLSIYYYYQSRFQYWRTRNVPYLEPKIPFGNLDQPWRKPLLLSIAHFYKTLRARGEKFGGVYLFAQPLLIVTDPALVKDILAKDFQHFHSRGVYMNEKTQPILANLAVIRGSRWKHLRQKLTPAFSSGRMKMMLSTMLNCVDPLKEAVDRLAEDYNVMNVKEVITKFMTDVIGSCAFGICCNSFENPNSEFYIYGVKALRESWVIALKRVFIMSCSRLATALGVTMLDRDVEQFFTNLATETYHYRKANRINRNDFMQMLIEMKDSADPSNSITMDELVAQMFLFFVGGLDTSSAVLSFCLFQLAEHPKVQERLRDEIKHVLREHSGEITYDGLQEMKYMDQVINETLRMYPIAPAIVRVCTETYKISDTDVIIEKGTRVLASPWGLHRDPEYFPDPEKFDPDRFFEENKKNIVPGTFLPFGDGPRNCIGARFAMMQMKICLAALLKDYEFGINLRMSLPLELDFGAVTTVRGGIWLNVRKIL